MKKVKIEHGKVIEISETEKSEEETKYLENETENIVDGEDSLVKKKIEISDEDVEKDKSMFRFSAFLFTFAYCFAKGKWRDGIISFIITIILPLQLYFVFGLAFGFYESKGNDKKVTPGSAFISCVSVLVFCIAKILMKKLVGTV